MIRFSISEDTEKLEDRLQCLKYLATHTVEVGLTSTASGRSRTLLAIHEHAFAEVFSVLSQYVKVKTGKNLRATFELCDLLRNGVKYVLLFRCQ